MYRLVTVDSDETLRHSPVQNVDWAGYGFEVATQAASGKETLYKIDGSMPQLIATDIQVPIVDGLQLTKTINRLCPEVKIALLTAYKEFEHVERVLEYKISQYTLKYGSQDAVLGVVLRAARQIEAESGSQLLRGKSLDMQRRNSLREINCNKVELRETQAQAGRLGISLSCG